MFNATACALQLLPQLQVETESRHMYHHLQEPGLLQKALSLAAARGDAQLLRGLLQIFREKKWQAHLGPVIKAR